MNRDRIQEALLALAFFDARRWQPSELVRRGRGWLRARPGRRRMAWVLLGVFVALVIPGVVGAVATAQSDTLAAAGAPNSGLSWMNITDSHGVRLSDYIFVTDHGNVLNPGKTALALVIELEFAGYMVLVTSAIWLIGFALSFGWLDQFANALTGTAHAFTGQIATPLVLFTAAAIGTFFVAWFTVRGFHAKAAMQVVTMLGLAVLGPLFLAEPLAEVLSSDGVLVKGRDVGLTVAAGLNGHNHTNPSALVATMQGDLADSFARRPLQTWNFGSVIDNSCGHTWTTGMRGGDPDKVRENLKSCDASAASAAANPSAGQVATGFLLLFCAAILLLFALYLSAKVLKSALDAIYHGFMAIFGFAAGGFVYGPTQTFLVRNLVDTVIAAARMAAFTIFLGIYVLFLASLFDQAKDQVVQVLFIAAVVELVAVSQLRKLSASLDRGNDWMANRFSLAIQGQDGHGGGSGGMGAGDGRALGMGMAHGQGGIGTGFGMLAGLAALSTVSGSPATAWLLGRTMDPLSPRARRRQQMELRHMEYAPLILQRQQWLQSNRHAWERAARRRASGVPGGQGIHSPLGVANVIDGLGDSGAPKQEINGALASIGADNFDMLHVDRALAVQNGSMSRNPYGFVPLQKASAAWEAVHNHPVDAKRGLQEHLAFAAQANVAATNFARHSRRPRFLHAGDEIDWGFVRDVEQNWDFRRDLDAAISPDRWRAAGSNTRHHIGSRLAVQMRDRTFAYYQNPTVANRDRVDEIHNRIKNLDHMDEHSGPDLWDP